MRSGQKIGDVLAADGTIKTEIRLTAEQTKGKHARTVILAEKLRKELLHYLQQRFGTKQLIALSYTDKMSKPLFNTQKRDGFTANTACYHFHMLYRAAGLDGKQSQRKTQFFNALVSKSCAVEGADGTCWPSPGANHYEVR